MAHPHGRKIKLTPNRRFMCDLMYLSRGVPLISMQRVMHLGELAKARRAVMPRPSWCAMFTKAYALVAARNNVLRQAYISFPTPHLYEHPVNVASVSVERKIGDEDAVFFTHIRRPETHRLNDIDVHLQRCKDAPVESIGTYKRLLTVSKLPWLLRRLLWWYGFHTTGHRRARYFGTFGVSVVSGQQSETIHLQSPVATTLNYGIVEPDGKVTVRMQYDHRVLDGCTGARILNELDTTLMHEILDEVRAERVRSAA